MGRRSARSPAWFGFWLLLAVVLLCPSCSGRLNTVRGKVLYEDKPIKGAVVVFHLKGDKSATALRPTGVTDENGVFTLSTQDEAGAAPGDYVVTVLWPEEPPASTEKGKGMPSGRPKPVDKFKGEYADPATSKLTATIKPGTNELEPYKLN